MAVDLQPNEDVRDPATARVDARLAVAVARGLLLDVLATGGSAETDAAMERFTQLIAAQLNG